MLLRGAVLPGLAGASLKRMRPVVSWDETDSSWRIASTSGAAKADSDAIGVTPERVCGAASIDRPPGTDRTS
jgi:hypothetical protein